MFLRLEPPEKSTQPGWKCYRLDRGLFPRRTARRGLYFSMLIGILWIVWVRGRLRITETPGDFTAPGRVLSSPAEREGRLCRYARSAFPAPDVLKDTPALCRGRDI